MKYYQHKITKVFYSGWNLWNILKTETEQDNYKKIRWDYKEIRIMCKLKKK